MSILEPKSVQIPEDKQFEQKWGGERTAQIQILEPALKLLVNDNPGKHNPSDGVYCVYQKDQPIGNEHKYCIVGALLNMLEFELPQYNEPFDCVAPQEIETNTARWLADIQQIFDHHSKHGGTWSTAYDELKQRGYV